MHVKCYNHVTNLSCDEKLRYLVQFRVKFVLQLTLQKYMCSYYVKIFPKMSESYSAIEPKRFFIVTNHLNKWKISQINLK